MGRFNLACFWNDLVTKYPNGIVRRNPNP